MSAADASGPGYYCPHCLGAGCTLCHWKGYRDQDGWLTDPSDKQAQCTTGFLTISSPAAPLYDPALLDLIDSRIALKVRSDVSSVAKRCYDIAIATCAQAEVILHPKRDGSYHLLPNDLALSEQALALLFTLPRLIKQEFKL